MQDSIAKEKSGVKKCLEICAIKGGQGVGPLMANAILNFHFDFPHTSLTQKMDQIFAYQSICKNNHWGLHMLQEKRIYFFFCLQYNLYYLLVNNVARKCHLSVEQSEERHRGMREHFPSGTKHSKVLGKYLRLCTKYLNPLLTEAPLTEDFLVI